MYESRGGARVRAEGREVERERKGEKSGILSR